MQIFALLQEKVATRSIYSYVAIECCDFKFLKIYMLTYACRGFLQSQSHIHIAIG